MGLSQYLLGKPGVYYIFVATSSTNAASPCPLQLTISMDSGHPGSSSELTGQKRKCPPGFGPELPLLEGGKYPKPSYTCDCCSKFGWQGRDIAMIHIEAILGIQAAHNMGWRQYPWIVCCHGCWAQNAKNVQEIQKETEAMYQDSHNTGFYINEYMTKINAIGDKLLLGLHRASEKHVEETAASSQKDGAELTKLQKAKKMLNKLTLPAA